MTPATFSSGSGGSCPPPPRRWMRFVTADWRDKAALDRARGVASAIAAKVARGVPISDAARQGGAGVSPVRPFGARRLNLAQVPPQFAAPMQILFSLTQGKSRMIADP